MKITDVKELEEIARRVRVGIIEGTYNAKSGHPGGSLSIADILTVLYFNVMNINEKDPKSNIKDIDKTKYLVPADLTVANFSGMIRKRIEIPEEAAFYLLANGKSSLTGDKLLSEVYDSYKDPEDGFLYIAYASELTWGINN